MVESSISREELQRWIEEYPTLGACYKVEGVPRSTLRHACRREQLFFKSQKPESSSNQPPTIQEEADAIKQKAVQRDEAQLRRQIIKKEYLASVIREAVGEGIPYRSPPPWKLISKRQDEEEALCLIFSDLHYGEKVNPSEVNSYNAYNCKIAVERFREYERRVHAILDIMGKRCPVNRIFIFYDGDIVEGHGIYPGQSYHLDLDAGKSALESAQMLAELEIRLLDHLKRYATKEPKIECWCVVGNHGVPGGRRRAGAGLPFTTNWDWVAYQFKVQMTQQYPQIINHIPESWWVEAEVFDKQILMMHGDGIPMYLRMPWYGIERAMLEYTQITNKTFDYYILGHFHRDAQISGNHRKKIIVNGCWSGMNRFAKDIRQASSPTQLVFGLHPKIGITAVYDLHLTKEE